MAGKKLVIKLTEEQAKGIKEALSIERPVAYLQIALSADPAEVAGMGEKPWDVNVTIGDFPPPGSPPPGLGDSPVSLY